MAELLRQVVADHLQNLEPGPDPDYLKRIVALGEDPIPDISERHDDYLGDAFAHERAD